MMAQDRDLRVCSHTPVHRDSKHSWLIPLLPQIHERDRFADFLLILLRDLLPAHPHLRVVLMSATLHIDLFSAYFGGCPVIQVGLAGQAPGKAPGLTSGSGCMGLQGSSASLQKQHSRGVCEARYLVCVMQTPSSWLLSRHPALFL